MLDIKGFLKNIAGAKGLTVVLLLAISALGFYLRFDNLFTWLNNKNFYFTSSGLPITLGTDPYYYMDIARDLLSGTIKAFDEMRSFPTGGMRPSSAPLLAVILATVSFLSGQPLEWVAVLIPPFLGVLLAVPVYFLGFALVFEALIPGREGGRVSLNEARFTGAMAALFALISPPLVVRSSIGWCDTDILNVTWPVLCIFLSIAFSTAKTREAAHRFFWAWLVAFSGFAWWWDQSFTPVLFLGGIPMFLAVVLRGKEHLTKKQFLSAIPVAVILLSVFAWQGEWLTKGQNLLSYVFELDYDSVFPPFASLVDEQRDMNFTRLAANIAGNSYLYFGSIAGLLPLIFLARKKFIFLLPLLCLSALATQGMRFIIFTVPLFGLGVAAILLTSLLLLRRMKSGRYAVVFCLALIVIRPPIAESQRYNAGRPVLSPGVYDGMLAIAGNTPVNSVIWSSWGHGHPLVYYADRRTIGDGMLHSAGLDYVSKFPLATNNFQLSANWIQFYTKNGAEGLHKAFQTLTGDRQNWAAGTRGLTKLLGAGIAGSRKMLINDHGLSPEEAESFLAFLFPPDCPPVYLFMDYKLLSEGWYELGKWNLTNSSGPKKYTLIPVKYYARTRFSVQGDSDVGGFSVDLQNGIFSQNGKQTKLSEISIDDGGLVDRLRFPERGRALFMYLAGNSNRSMSGLIATFQVKDTVLVKLFFEKQLNPYFEMLNISDPPVYMVCKVTGDKYSPSLPS